MLHSVSHFTESSQSWDWLETDPGDLGEAASYFTCEHGCYTGFYDHRLALVNIVIKVAAGEPTKGPSDGFGANLTDPDFAGEMFVIDYQYVAGHVRQLAAVVGIPYRGRMMALDLVGEQFMTGLVRTITDAVSVIFTLYSYGR